MILFGHPTGNPNSHHAALAHFAAGRLAAFCVPWMPGSATLKALSAFPPMRAEAARLSRRHFAPLAAATKIQGRWGEWRRLFLRSRGRGSEGLSYEANDWLMRTMARVCHRSDVSAVHAYEDCALWQFEAAKGLQKNCIYDMPIGYYPWWQEKQAQLAKQFVTWLPGGGLPSNRWARPDQKRREMELADLVLAPGSFVRDTIREFHPAKKVAMAPYGVDLEFWCPRQPLLLPDSSSPLKFIYAGQSSIRKGIPVLLEAWRLAALKNAHLELVGSWQMAPEKLRSLPLNVSFTGPVSREKLRACYQQADVFLFPSFFEGFGLVILEAMACALPVVATQSSAGPDILDDSCGRIAPAGHLEAWVEMLRWFSNHREKIPAMKQAARAKAETCTWSHYRQCVSAAVASLI